jgi:UDP:flavonoid glycosyltransferase YjiC (YdhE family)
VTYGTDDRTSTEPARHVAVYVTNHGFGHINRVVAVLDQLPESVRITVRADPEVREALEQRLNRPFGFGSFPSDRGTASPPGQNSRTDIPATFEKLEDRLREIDRASASEVRWLREAGVSAVYADASVRPMALAAQAGIPAYLAANFTWDEIYSDLLSRANSAEIPDERRPALSSLVDQMREDCREATLLRCWPHTPMRGIGRTAIDVGLVVNPARDVRGEILKKFSLAAEAKLIYFYVGRYGVEELAWDRLDTLPPEFVFIGLHPPGRDLPGRFFTLDPSEFNGADLLRSCDAAVVKAGYGAVAEAMSAGTPVIYPPRVGFVEFDFLDQALRGWSGGVPISEEDFASLDLITVLEAAVKGRAEPPDVPVDGAARIAKILSHDSD